MIAVEGLSEGERDATLGTRGAVEARDIARRPRFSFDFVVGSNFLTRAHWLKPPSGPP